MGLQVTSPEFEKAPSPPYIYLPYFAMILVKSDPSQEYHIFFFILPILPNFIVGIPPIDLENPINIISTPQARFQRRSMWNHVGTFQERLQER